MLRGRAAPQAQLMLDKVLGEHLEGEARLTQASKALVAEQREAVGLAMSLVDQMDRQAGGMEMHIRMLEDDLMRRTPKGGKSNSELLRNQEVRGPAATRCSRGLWRWQPVASVHRSRGVGAVVGALTAGGGGALSGGCSRRRRLKRVCSLRGSSVWKWVLPLPLPPPLYPAVWPVAMRITRLCVARGTLCTPYVLTIRSAELAAERQRSQGALRELEKAETRLARYEKVEPRSAPTEAPPLESFALRMQFDGRSIYVV